MIGNAVMSCLSPMYVLISAFREVLTVKFHVMCVVNAFLILPLLTSYHPSPVKQV